MNILFYSICFFCRYVELEPLETLTMKDRVKNNTMYKFIYNTFGAKSVEVTLFDDLKRTIGKYTKTNGVIFTRLSSTGFLTIEIKNKNPEKIKFGYRCPDVNKEVQGALGPIKDEDAVAELLSVLENNILSQRRQIEKYENHFNLVTKSKTWVFRFVLFEIFTSIGILYYLHKNTLKMFEKKHVGN
ncbi:hypothetical protein NCER_101210 [Vairimorpha ceranae BRL01]|uniref:Endoplasmic reticulum membrane protein n=2 Tax=Vairimorpha ceranae TaxID=40302 RepID=C4V9H0_VAIC1|nr:endoplasmic reticulum membrane protein [Vairimorpha ceranae]EEQ82134.1 hypothetical protein NCER_101210 [Vairimorpha ceranae BRL01]KAF5140688.1 hypothetical protein G9O61_00g011840 [Vairimorpha ceranae]KKO76014.1 endoplasmic reticulum membrane protein [Vairimorpha ceranae]